MAALTATVPTLLGTVVASGAVAASDTIAQTELGSKGAVLLVINGNASPDNITISDFGTTQAGNSLPSNQITDTITNATNQAYLLLPSQVNPATQLITVTHSVTATVTYYLFRQQ
jgi:hypothetical protein